MSGVLKNPILSADLQALEGTEYVASLVQTFIILGFITGSVVFVFMMLVGGIKWITAGGDKAQIESARGKITHALVGLFVLFSTYAILSLIEVLFGTDITVLDLSSLKIGS